MSNCLRNSVFWYIPIYACLSLLALFGCGKGDDGASAIQQKGDPILTNNDETIPPPIPVDLPKDTTAQMMLNAMKKMQEQQQKAEKEREEQHQKELDELRNQQNDKGAGGAGGSMGIVAPSSNISSNPSSGGGGVGGAANSSASSDNGSSISPSTGAAPTEASTQAALKKAETAQQTAQNAAQKAQTASKNAATIEAEAKAAKCSNLDEILKQIKTAKESANGALGNVDLVKKASEGITQAKKGFLSFLKKGKDAQKAIEDAGKSSALAGAASDKAKTAEDAASRAANLLDECKRNTPEGIRLTTISNLEQNYADLSRNHGNVRIENEIRRVFENLDKQIIKTNNNTYSVEQYIARLNASAPLNIRVFDLDLNKKGKVSTHKVVETKGQ